MGGMGIRHIPLWVQGGVVVGVSMGIQYMCRFGGR